MRSYCIYLAVVETDRNHAHLVGLTDEALSNGGGGGHCV